MMTHNERGGVMTKAEFLDALCSILCHLPQEKIENARQYYSGCIDGRMECGMNEADAVAAMGSVEEAALKQINFAYKNPSHRISHKIKSMPTFARIVSSGLLSAVCFAAVGIFWVASIALYILVAAVGICGVLSILSGLAMCFIRTVPVGLCVIGVGTVLLSIMFLLWGPTRIINRLCTTFTSFIKAKVRALLAKEALAV